MDEKRILVIGGGFAGLSFCRTFRTPGARVDLVDRKNHHLFQPLLYQVATCGLSGPQIAQPLRSILARRKAVTTYLDEITGIDLDQRVARSQEHEYPYDYLVVGMGARTSYFGNDHWGEHAHGLKTLNDAIAIRHHVLKSFEAAEMEPDPEQRRRLMTMVVVGGGPTGVEMAGALAELSRTVLRRNFRHINPDQTRVVLLEGDNRILNTFHESLSEKGRRQVESLGVEVRTGAMVSNVEAGRISFGDEHIEAGTLIWGAGVEPVPVVKNLPVDKDRAGRIKVRPDCSIPGHPEAFVVGDCAHLVDARGKPVPGVSPAAMQMARHVARLIREEIRSGQPTPPEQRRKFAYNDKGNMATIGRSRAVAEVGGLRMAGWPAWLAWLFVHLVFLVGMRNRILVFLDWIYSYATYRRGARLILD